VDKRRPQRWFSALAGVVVLSAAIAVACDGEDTPPRPTAPPPTATVPPHSTLGQVLETLRSKPTHPAKRDFLNRAECAGEPPFDTPQGRLWEIRCAFSDGQAAIFFVADDLSNVVPLNPLAQDLLAP
jgi:hypothetical protein